MITRLPKSRQTRAAVARAASRFKGFTGMDVEHIEVINIPALPKAAFAIGRLIEVRYETVRDGKVERYYHPFKSSARPLLCSSPDGKQLLIVGGRYNMTNRGIVDK